MRMNFTKKSLVLFLFVSVIVHTTMNAQPVVPNGSFENWNNSVLFNAPSDWMSSPMMDGSYVTVQKVEGDASDGTTSVRLISVAEEDYIADGIVLFAEFSDDNVGGIPWTQTVDKLRASVKYNIVEGDAGLVLVTLYKEGSIIANVVYPITGSSTEWTTLTLPLVFGGDGTPVQPDKLFLAFVSSYPDEVPENLVGPGYDSDLFEPKAGSWLMVDDVYFTLGENPDRIPVANNSFENWFSVMSNDPVGWQSNNSDFLESSDVPVTKSADAVEGEFSARLEVMDAYGSGDAVLELGQNGDGIDFTEKPQALAFSYKYEPVDGDNGYLQMSFNGNDGEEQYDYFGGFWYPISEATNGFVETFSAIDVGKGGTFTPEKLNMEIRAGNKSGTVLYVDNIRFVDLNNVALVVLADDTNQPLAFATVTLSGTPFPMHTNETGRIDYQLPDGDYTYKIAAQGYVTQEGSFTMPVDGGFVNIRMSPFVPDPELPVLTLIDDDEDKVYFEGDTFSVEVKLPGSIMVPNGASVVLTQYLYSNTFDDPETYTVFEEGTLSATDLNDNKFTISGKVGPVDKLGVIGFNFVLKLGFVEYPVGTYPIVDTYRYNSDLSDYGLALVGLKIPQISGVTTEPAFSEIVNLYGFRHNPENDVQVKFIREGFGNIMFDYGLNIVDNRDQLLALSTGFKIESSIENGFYAEINPISLPFLASRNALITIENIPSGIHMEEIKVVLSSFGSDPDEFSGEIDLNDVSLTEGVFRFSVWGFSRYTLQHPDLVLTSLKPNVEQGFTIYPNPVAEQIYIRSDRTMASAIIMDLRGTVLQKHTFDGDEGIKTDRLQSGYYLLKVEFEDGKHLVTPFIKK